MKDESVLKACVTFLNEHKTLIEPFCGVGLAAVYENREFFKNYQKIVIIVCGGNHCSVNQIEQWKQKYSNSHKIWKYIKIMKKKQWNMFF